MEDRKMIEVKFVESGFLTRWPCHVCGGCTEKVDILCEGVAAMSYIGHLLLSRFGRGTNCGLSAVAA